MDFLKPPTDNLYKFLAMSGLLLLLVSQTYPPWLSHRLNISLYELEKDQKILGLEIKAEETRGKDFKAEVDVIRDVIRDVLRADVDDTGKEVENLKRLVESLPSRARVSRRLLQKRRLLQARVDENKKRLDENEKRLLEKRATFMASSDALDQKQIELEYKLDVLKWTHRQIKLLGWVALFGDGLGALMATWGFILWYRRVQVYQDAILRKQAAALESEGKGDLPESLIQNMTLPNVTQPADGNTCEAKPVDNVGAAAHEVPKKS